MDKRVATQTKLSFFPKQRWQRRKSTARKQSGERWDDTTQPSTVLPSCTNRSRYVESRKVKVWTSALRWFRWLLAWSFLLACLHAVGRRRWGDILRGCSSIKVLLRLALYKPSRRCRCQHGWKAKRNKWCSHYRTATPNDVQNAKK